MIQDHIRDYIGLDRYHARLYRTIQEYTGPYKTNTGKMFFDICNDNLLKNFKYDICMTTNENSSLAANGALAHRLQYRTACKMQNGHQGAPKWRTGSGKVSTTRFLGVLSNFC